MRQVRGWGGAPGFVWDTAEAYRTQSKSATLTCVRGEAAGMRSGGVATGCSDALLGTAARACCPFPSLPLSMILSSSAIVCHPLLLWRSQAFRCLAGLPCRVPPPNSPTSPHPQKADPSPQTRFPMQGHCVSRLLPRRCRPSAPPQNTPSYHHPPSPPNQSIKDVDWATDEALMFATLLPCIP